MPVANINPTELLGKAKVLALDLIGKAEAYLEGLIGVDINAEFLILCGLGVVALVAIGWLSVLAWRKLFPGYL